MLVLVLRCNAIARTFAIADLNRIVGSVSFGAVVNWISQCKINDFLLIVLSQWMSDVDTSVGQDSSSLQLRLGNRQLCLLVLICELWQ